MRTPSRRPRKPAQPKLVRVPNVLHGLGALALHRHKHSQNRLAIRRVPQRDVQRRLLRGCLEPAAAQLPGAHRAHRQRLRQGRGEPVRHVPRVLGPAAGRGLHGGRGAVHEDGGRPVRPCRGARFQDGLQDRLILAEPRELRFAVVDAEHVLEIGGCELG